VSGGYGTFGDGRYQDWVHQPASLSGIASWLRGKHSIKYGVQLYQNQFWYTAGDYLSGTYNFTGEITGNGVAGRNNPINAVADLLVGAIKTADYPVQQIPVNRLNYNLGLFFQDDWKATRRLTLNLGLRYEFETNQIVKNNVYSRVELGTGALLVANQNASRNLNLNNDYVNFRELSVSVRRAGFFQNGEAYFWFLSGGWTLMNSLSHFWCLSDLVGRPPGKVRSSSSRSEIRSCSAHRQLGSFWLLDPATWYPKSLTRPL
jgi:outer membrane receptor protein involved in Fe transport